MKSSLQILIRKDLISTESTSVKQKMAMEPRGSGFTALRRELIQGLNGVFGAYARRRSLVSVRISEASVLVFGMSLPSNGELERRSWCLEVLGKCHTAGGCLSMVPCCSTLCPGRQHL